MQTQTGPAETQISVPCVCPRRSSMPRPPSASTSTTTAAPHSSSWALWWCRHSWLWQPRSSAVCSESFESCFSFSRLLVPGTEGGCWTGRVPSTPGSDSDQTRGGSPRRREIIIKTWKIQSSCFFWFEKRLLFVKENLTFCKYSYLVGEILLNCN